MLQVSGGAIYAGKVKYLYYVAMIYTYGFKHRRKLDYLV